METILSLNVFHVNRKTLCIRLNQKPGVIQSDWRSALGTSVYLNLVELYQFGQNPFSSSVPNEVAKEGSEQTQFSKARRI